MSNSNVVHFPKEKIVRDAPKLEEEALELIKLHKKKAYAEDLILGISENILLALDHNGVNVMSKSFAKDFNYSMDCLRASIYRQMDLPHHLHDYITNEVSLLDDEGNPIQLD